MQQTILVCVAWPYANGYAHLGQIAGAYLPADICARFHRLRGDRVLMVSGSDSHGTPVTLQADEEGTSPKVVFDKYHDGFLKSFLDLGLSFNLFTHTNTANHHRVAQDIFLRLLERGLLFRKTESQIFCENDRRFLPDRYIYGTCPHCGFAEARGDQCQHCDHVHDALELGHPQCKLQKAGEAPHRIVVRKTEHYYLNLPALEQAILTWFEKETRPWRPNVVNFARNYVASGLKARAITRDIDWGVPAPIEGWDSKRLYVWFEAVIGYLSATIEWASHAGEPDAWKDFWYTPARTYYFVGKDNVPFHAILWPAMLAGIGDLYDPVLGRSMVLPFDIPANEFMNLEGAKFSKGDKWAVWLPDALRRYDADAIRYYLTSIAPETHDSDWSWNGFLHHHNDELVGAWGKLANRVLTFASQHFDRRVPTPGELEASDGAILSLVEAGFETVGDMLEHAQFRSALAQLMSIAREANRYLDDTSPWKCVQADPTKAAKAIFVALRVVDSLKVMFAPFLPHTAQALHAQLGYDDDLSGHCEIRTFSEADSTHRALCYAEPSADNRWKPSRLAPGQSLRDPMPLYQKLDARIVAEERARLGK